MSTSGLVPREQACDPPRGFLIDFSISDDRLVALFFGLLLFSVVAACSAPALFSVAVVALFAAPHNWIEGRYFLCQIVPRWGKLAGYFSVSLVGVVVLAAAYFAMPLAVWNDWISASQLPQAIRAWHIGFALWLSALLLMRTSQKPKRLSFDLCGPFCLVVLAVAIEWPTLLSVMLVFAHPLVALVFLDRESTKRPVLRSGLRRLMWVLPVAVTGMGVLFWRREGAAGVATENSPETSFLAAQLTRQVGVSIDAESLAMFLVAVHAVLETLHYGVWLVGMPVVSGTGLFRPLANAPLASRPMIFRPLALAVSVLAPFVVILFWAGFTIDYVVTRDLYFAIAMGHVLAEIPFLLRKL